MPEHDKEVKETELVRRLLLTLGYMNAEFVLNPGDRPDVQAVIRGCSIGVEVTEFHADEEPGHKGSVSRASEEKAAKETGEQERS
jgi:hypothetical protein